MVGTDSRIDILLATYNGADYIRAQIDSIINQTYTNWRLLVSDDGSTDGTVDIIQEYVEKDKRIVLVSNGRKYGSARDNFMGLMRKATADYVAFCDQDDIWKKNKLEITISVILANEKRLGSSTPLLVYTDLQVVDKKLESIASSYYSFMNINPLRSDLNELLVQNVVTGCTMLINNALRLLVLETGAINDKRIIMHDWYMGIFASIYGQLIYVPQATVLYRQHGDNSVGATKFSVLRWIAGWKTNLASVSNSFDQAEVVLKGVKNTHHEMPKNQSMSLLREFLSIRHKPFFLRPKALRRGNFLKSNVSRRLGQYVFVLFV